jgi:transposase
MNSPEQDDARSEQELLKSEQESHRNMIEDLLRQVGMPAGDPCRSDYLDWLAQQRDWEGNPVPPRLLGEITREHARLRLVMEQLAELEDQ